MNSNRSTGAEPMLSIVVPVFNVVAYIDAGLQSISEQSFEHELEVILIDDCSTDGSLDVCRKFASDYPERFSLIACEVNGGVSVARNLGLDRACGRYLMFFDPDDILPPGACAQMCAAAEQHDADVVKGNLVLFDDNSRRPASDRVNQSTLIRGADVLTTLFEHSRIRGHIGGKIYRRDRFDQLRFTVGVRMAQDLLFFSELFAGAGSLLLLAADVYEYRKHRTGSTGRKYQKGSYIDWLQAVENSGRFATDQRQRRAHKGLLVRTMTQIARECRKIPADNAGPVLATIEQKSRQWRLGFFQLIVDDRLGLRTLSRYLKLQLALKQIRRKLTGAGSD